MEKKKKICLFIADAFHIFQQMAPIALLLQNTLFSARLIVAIHWKFFLLSVFFLLLLLSITQRLI